MNCVRLLSVVDCELCVSVISNDGIPFLRILQNRKNDETAYMQMLKLKRDLAKAR